MYFYVKIEILMDIIQVNDRKFKKFIPAGQIDKTVRGLAGRLNLDLKDKDPLFVVVLNGAFIFASDLFRNISLDSEIAFIKLSSYAGMKSTKKVREVVGLDRSVADRTVVILEDIIDTGRTMGYAMNRFREMGAKDVRLVTLLFKPGAFDEAYKIDYTGMEIPNDFIVGYGLDYDGYGRNYKDIYRVVRDQ